MLRSVNELKDYAVRATDGVIGHVKNCYFDDEQWVVRYLIVDAGSWLSSRKVLISPVAVGALTPEAKVLPVSITMDQVRHSPHIDTDKPISRQYEMLYHGYYGYPWYWGGAGLWGGGIYPAAMLTRTHATGPTADYLRAQAEYERSQAESQPPPDGDPHLRSCDAVINYHIQASDGEIGHVDGVLVDVETWAIRYLIANTSQWWLGHQVLVAPQWIKAVSWFDETVAVELTRQAIRDAPIYDSSVPLDRDQELRIFTHYGRASYWESETMKASTGSTPAPSDQC